jgi:CO/xanthine dehydrogenase Mo-binding subunit
MTEITAQPRRYDRRKFLAGTGALVVAINTPRLLNPQAAYAAVNEFPIGPASIDPNRLDSWIAIKGDGTVLVKSGKEELGQGMATAVAQVVADELDVPVSKIDQIISDTWHTVNQGGTSGSNSSPTQFNMVRDGVPQFGVRRAAAEARLALLNLASTALGQPVSALSVKDGVVSGGGKSVSYASLIGDKTFNVPLSGKATPKRFQDYKVVGTSVPRVDIPAKVFGKFTYNQDVRLPGMVHARIVRPPTLDSQLVSIDGFPQKVPGLIKVVVKKNLVAVVTEREEQAIAAAAALKTKWNVAPLPPFEQLYDNLVAMAPANATNRVLIDTKDVDAALAKGKKLEAEYRYPIQMHGPMGASAAQAWVQGNTATVWTHTQNVTAERAMLATALSIPAQNIRVIYVEGSGVYGLTNADNAGMDAAVISQAVGRPVKVNYSRADDHTAENYGNPYVHRMKGAVDAGGTVIAWDAESWTASRGSRPGPPANVPSGVLMGFPENPIAKSPAPTPSQQANNVDGSNSAPHYIVKSQRMITHSGRLPFFSGPLRAPNRMQNTFANESFMDELAHAAGADPVAFRIAHLKAAGGPPDDERQLRARLTEAIERNAAQAKWQARPAASKIAPGRFKTGRGVAAMVYEGDNGINSSIWQVTVDTKTGKVVVDKCWSVQDCGPIMNPTGMRMQAEGSLMQGTSRSLIEEVKWGPNGVSSRDWASYPVIRFNQVPKFDLQLVNRPDHEVMGAGEVLITNAPAGIANAIFDATGVRLRQVPFTPTRVRAALKAAGKLTA